MYKKLLHGGFFVFLAFFCLIPATSGAVSEHVEWSFIYDTPAYPEEFYVVELDANDNAYVAGWPGIFKLSAEGELMWHVEGRTFVLKVDEEGNTYSCAYNISTGRDELVKHDTDGNLLWVNPLYDTGRFYCQQILLDGDDNILVAGIKEWVQNYYAYSDVAVTKLRPDGSLIWRAEKSFGNNDYTRDMKLDYEGNIIVSAYVAGPYGIGIVKFDPSGNILWGTLHTEYSAGSGNIAVDSLDNIYLLSYSAILKLHPNGTLLAARDVSGGNYMVIDSTGDLYVARNSLISKFDSGLNLIWERALYNTYSRDLKVDDRDNLYIAGSRRTYPPKIVTYKFDSDGNLLFYDLYSGIWYGYGVSVAVGSDYSIYTAAYTWFNRSYYYGGALIKYHVPLCDETPRFEISSFSPDTIWPPNGKEQDVSITGTVSIPQGCSLLSASYSVDDEYGTYSSGGDLTVDASGSFSLVLPVEARRDGQDRDGRHYHITLHAADEAGTGTSEVLRTVVPHDQR